MGSLSLPPPPPPSPPRPSEIPMSDGGYRIYAPFCSRELADQPYSNWIQQYDPSSNTWTYVTSIPGLIENQVLKDFAMVSIGQKILIIGGILCYKVKAENSYDCDEILEKNVKVLSNVLCYNIVTDQWSECAPLNVPRYDFACTVCDDKIFVAGGQSTLASAKGISAAEMYDPVIDKWTPLPNMNRLRYKCVAVTWQGKIHVVGGFVDTYTIDRCSAEVYNAKRGKWDLVVRMWQLDIPPNQIVAINDNLFSSGDCLNAWKGHIETYDGRLNLWNIVEGSQLRNFPSYGAQIGEFSDPGQRLYLTMASIGRELYFLTSYKVLGESSKIISMVHSFDTLRYVWKSFEPMQEEGQRELCAHCCVVQLS